MLQVEKLGFMDLALDQARAAGARGEVPVGAVLVSGDQVVSADGNRNRELADVTAHAEIQVLRAAMRLRGSDRLPDCDLYVTLEPCTMCAAAISFARIRRLYYGADDPKGGAVDNGVRVFASAACHHAPEVYCGLCAADSADLLRVFFTDRR